MTDIFTTLCYEVRGTAAVGAFFFHLLISMVVSVVTGAISAAMYAAMNLIEEVIIAGAVPAIGIDIAFYYGSDRVHLCPLLPQC